MEYSELDTAQLSDLVDQANIDPRLAQALMCKLARLEAVERKLESALKYRYTPLEVAEWLNAYPHPSYREKTLVDWVASRRERARKGSDGSH